VAELNLILLKRYRTGHGRCSATLHDWVTLTQDDRSCECDSRQTVIISQTNCRWQNILVGSKRSSL